MPSIKILWYAFWSTFDTIQSIYMKQNLKMRLSLFSDAATKGNNAGLADSNHLDLNHWFKSRFKSINFFIQISDLNQYFFYFLKITDKSNSCSLFWSLLLFLSTLSAPYRSFILIWISSFESTWFTSDFHTICSRFYPRRFLLFERKFVWFLLHNWNWHLLGIVLNYFGWLLVVLGGWNKNIFKKSI